MKIEQIVWQEGHWQGLSSSSQLDSINTLIIVFGRASDASLVQLSAKMPHSQVIGCSTAGEIIDNTILENAVVATIILFEKSTIHLASAHIEEGMSTSFNIGVQLGQELSSHKDDLKHVFVLSDGLLINGGHLVEGFHSVLPKNIKVTGGLAGDGERFEQTTVIFGNRSCSGLVVALGLYGEQLSVGYGSRGGWCPFGMERKVTRSTDNVLYELDDQDALSIYKTYLGDLAQELPASGLRFPLEISVPGQEIKLVRTLLAIDETQGSITFAGNVPKGVTAKLMRASSESLIEGARNAASLCHHDSSSPALAILISCVGRRLLLRQLAEDEVEAVSEELGENTRVCGFYSYGEIAPSSEEGSADLHNQTMTITTLSEM
ncbi:FIST signal transduction protein [Vibrio vulnificus]|uniref:FIST signal transduction protein n=1 Tax=Vibrio vulnificus TaxID=672 RepID=UPI001028E9AE|nr:FIST N-terminal domain-containing protein [Vibrio vulnificus]EJO9874382.1 FIST C-terminal domain-containing protein [Vibrio vulnificus]EKZ9180371.1 FIST C-terminal domain-containing protein [Vibrio vulnificus]MCA3907862.1 FIST C-terminal domain-containing protein [Vibrio vulnificus]MCA3928008.1 FIST C-terminal domain-containing protein [Vibrio vulnificus]RZP54710.1 hypothetical protein D8T48_18120 [Vibrio vulnificus]